MNVQSYCDYLISEAYCGNQDSGNIRFFRSPDYDGGRFHWIVYDVDLGFQNAAVPYGFYTSSTRTGPARKSGLSTVLVNRLLKNPEFRATFIERMAYLMQNVFTTDNLIAHIDRFEQILKPEIGRDLDKWGGSSAVGPPGWRGCAPLSGDGRRRLRRKCARAASSAPSSP